MAAEVQETNQAGARSATTARELSGLDALELGVVRPPSPTAVVWAAVWP